jgi:hypothetical protein
MGLEPKKAIGVCETADEFSDHQSDAGTQDDDTGAPEPVSVRFY